MGHQEASHGHCNSIWIRKETHFFGAGHRSRLMLIIGFRLGLVVVIIPPSRLATFSSFSALATLA